MTTRISAALRYEGTAYHGWQVQISLKSVQSEVEKALSIVANHQVSIVCAGRTDAGVHAAAQVIHFDTCAERSNHSWIFGANSNLPADIAVLWVKKVPNNFHARYSALTRKYRYIIYNHQIRPGILRHQVGWYYRELDERKMQAAAHYLLGTHDFSSFRGRGCQAKSVIRCINHIEVVRMGHMIMIEIQANAFLLHMVRNIVGVLVAIGSGDKPTAWMQTVLDAKDRTQAGITMSPCGLYLVQVDYPKEFNLPVLPIGPFFIP